MLTEREISNLADTITGGAEEAYVADLTNALIDDFSNGVINATTANTLSALAAKNRDKINTLLMSHKGAISKTVIDEITSALLMSDKRDADTMARFGHTSPATTEKHAAMIADQTAIGVREMIERQNIALAEQAAKTWYEVATEAITAANNGATGKTGAVEQAVLRLSKAGISTIDYRSGIHNQVDVAIKRHMRTQVNQASARMAIDRMDATGWRFVQTTTHFGARSEHADWQGKAFCLDGAHEVDGVAYPDFYTATGYGTVTGLCGANCRHHFGIHVPGISSLPTLPDEINGMTSDDYYAATQRQRELERRIRATKREIAGLERTGLGLESPSYVQKRLVLGKQQRTLAAHCKGKQLVRQPAREKAYGVGSQPRALRNYVYWSNGRNKSYTLSSIASFEEKYRGTTGREVGMVFDKNGKDLLLLEGEGHHIRFKKPSGYKWDELHFAHTHPNEHGGTFSMDDIYFLCDSGALSLRAVCNEGTYLIERGADAKPRVFMKAYDRAFIEASAESAGRSELTARMHSWLSKNAKLYGFRYDLENKGVK